MELHEAWGSLVWESATEDLHSRMLSHLRRNPLYSIVQVWVDLIDDVMV
jgi:hypothetical protein